MRYKQNLMNTKGIPYIKSPRLIDIADTTLKMAGDTMEPTIEPGDELLIKYIKSYQSVEPGDICLIKTEEYTFLRRIYPNIKTKKLLLKSDNNTRYPDFELSISKITEISLVIGFTRSVGAARVYL